MLPVSVESISAGIGRGGSCRRIMTKGIGEFDVQLLPGLRRMSKIWFVVALVASMTACASGSRLVDHSFGFDARWDSPDAEILDYRYGNSNFPGVRACPKRYSHCEKIPQGANTNGEMPLGDDLYVKWKIKSTGAVYEDTVDLRHRLPSDMKRQRIRFIVSGAQLYVYLISPERLNPNPCPSQEERRRLDHSAAPSDKVFSMYCSLKIIQIYPYQPASPQSK